MDIEKFWCSFVTGGLGTNKDTLSGLTLKCNHMFPFLLRKDEPFSPFYLFLANILSRLLLDNSI